VTHLQIYGTGSATANAVAQVTIPTQSRIRAVQVSLMFDMVADNSVFRVELSKASAGQIGTNGALDPFLLLGTYLSLVTSGMQANAINQTFGVDVPCRQGEIVYLHASGATTTFYFNGILWLD
jgi:hypothetical protein